MGINVEYGSKSFALEVAPERMIDARRESKPVGVADAATLFRHAVSSPTRFPALHLALTPDDLVAIVIDDWRHLKSAGPAIFDELHQAGVRDENVTIVGPSGAEPPESTEGYKTAQHDATDTEHRCYVATTNSGRRVYLNRTVVEADQVIVVAETHFDAERGISGGPLAIFPDMADTESQIGWKAMTVPDLRELAEEVAWLLGTVFYIHIIAGPGNSICQVIAGGPDSFTDARKTLQSFWRVTSRERADIAIATISTLSERTSMSDVVRALSSALRAVQSDGTVILCVDGAPDLSPIFVELSNYDSPEAAQLGLKKSKSDDAIYALRWLRAVSKARVAVLSEWTDEVVEGLFATALTKPSQIQKLIDRGGTLVVMSDAHRTRVRVNENEEHDSHLRSS